jgi:hypothetical protein
MENKKYIGTVFGAKIYTEAKDEDRIVAIMEFLDKKAKEAQQIELEQELSKFTRPND